MGEFRVTTATLQNKALELQQKNSQFKTAMDTLRQQEETLNGEWDGDAHDAFDREFKRDINRMTEFYNAIEDYAQKLQLIAKEYATAEKVNLATASTRNS